MCEFYESIASFFITAAVFQPDLPAALARGVDDLKRLRSSTTAADNVRSGPDFGMGKQSGHDRAPFGEIQTTVS